MNIKKVDLNQLAILNDIVVNFCHNYNKRLRCEKEENDVRNEKEI